MNSPLYIIGVISNPVEYKSRYSLYKKFATHMKESGAVLITVEAAFGERPWQVTEKSDPHHLQLRTNHELWHKESMINAGIRHLTTLHPDWKYMGWIDCDIDFPNKNWVSDVKQKLQHYHIIQPWSDCMDFGPNGEAMAWHKSFTSLYIEKGLNYLKSTSQGTKEYKAGLLWGHPGYAYCATREAIDAVGGLMDFPILGAADHHMAWALVGDVMRSSRKIDIHQNYLRALKKWEERAEKNIARNIGYLPGLILHGWHGKKKNRQYVERWQILANNDFDPETDIWKDSQGLWQLTGNKPKFRDDLRQYFRARHEDSIDTE